MPLNAFPNTAQSSGAAAQFVAHDGTITLPPADSLAHVVADTGNSGAGLPTDTIDGTTRPYARITLPAPSADGQIILVSRNGAIVPRLEGPVSMGGTTDSAIDMMTDGASMVLTSRSGTWVVTAYHQGVGGVIDVDDDFHLGSVNPIESRLALEAGTPPWTLARAQAGIFTAAGIDRCRYGREEYRLAVDIAQLRPESPVADTTARNGLADLQYGDCVAVDDDSGSIHTFGPDGWTATTSTTVPVIAGVATEEPGEPRRSWERLLSVVYLNRGALPEPFKELLGDQTALVSRDPDGHVFEPYGDGSTGGLLRVMPNTTVIDASWFGVKDDNDDSNTGTPTLEILEYIIEKFCKPKVSGFTSGTGGLATHGGYFIKLPVSVQGSGRVLIEDDLIIPDDKNVIVGFDVMQSGVIDMPNSDYGLRFFKGGQGSVKGVRNAILNGGGVEFIGRMNGHGIFLENVLGVKTADSLVQLIDGQDLSAAEATKLGTTTTELAGQFNVTQGMMKNITAYRCKHTIKSLATTYSVNIIQRVRSFSSEDTPLVLAGVGTKITDLEFIGVNRNNYDQSAFIHFDTRPGAVAHWTLENVRFGSEDTGIDGSIYHSPKQLIRFGGDENADGTTIDFDSSNNASKCSIRNVIMQREHSGNADYGSYPVEHGIRFDCQYHQMSIEGYAEELTKSAIYEGDVAADYQGFLGNVHELRTMGTEQCTLFSHGGRGWTDLRKPRQYGFGVNQLNDTDDLTSAHWAATRMTITKDQPNRAGIANAAHRLKIDDASPNPSIYGRNVHVSKGRYCLHLIVRSATGVKLTYWLQNASKATERVLQKGHPVHIGSDWVEIIEPLGYLDYSDLRAYLDLAGAVNDTLDIDTWAVWPGDQPPYMGYHSPYMGGTSSTRRAVPAVLPHGTTLLGGNLQIPVDAVPSGTDDKEWYPVGTVFHLSNGTTETVTTAGAPPTTS